MKASWVLNATPEIEEASDGPTIALVLGISTLLMFMVSLARLHFYTRKHMDEFSRSMWWNEILVIFVTVCQQSRLTLILS